MRKEYPDRIMAWTVHDERRAGVPPTVGTSNGGGCRRWTDARIGLKDALLPPDGRVASGNAELVAAALELVVLRS